MASKIVAAKVEQMKPLEVPHGGWNLSFEIVALEINSYENIKDLIIKPLHAFVCHCHRVHVTGNSHIAWDLNLVIGLHVLKVVCICKFHGIPILQIL